MLKRLSGKKTYLVAGAMLGFLGGLLYFGKLTPELAFEVLVFAAPCFAATYRDALQQHHNQVADLLMDIVDAGLAARTHNYAALEDAALKAAGDAMQVGIVTTGTATATATVTSALSPGTTP